jgi:uncharacterized protein YbjT (DUF2867 family)
MDSQGKTAIVIGATGLVGSQLVSQLLDDARFGRVVVLARRPTGRRHARLEEHRVDFEQLSESADALHGDVLFSAMGTTRKTAGSIERQRRVDYDYQYQAAALAARNGVPGYVLISSGGANAASPFAYMRMKGELEQAVARLPFRYVHILRPGFLDGDRREHRPGETLGLAVTRWATRLGPLARFRPIPDRTVARAMIAVAFDDRRPLSIHQPTSLFDLAGSPG